MGGARSSWALAVYVALALGLQVPLSRASVPPDLSVTRAPRNEILLRWSNAVPVVVESSPRLGRDADWQRVTHGVDLETQTATVAASEAARYFRTRQSPSLLRVTHTSPQPGQLGVSVLREVVLTFSEALPESVNLNTSNCFAVIDARPLLGRVELAADRRSATLFHLEPVPGNAHVRVQLNPQGFSEEAAALVDFDGNDVAGGSFSMVYATHATAGTPGTSIAGRVLAAEQVRDASGTLVDRPLSRVTVTVDGAEETLRTLSDDQGYFRLDPCPAGTFFVHIDGRTAVGSQWPNGEYYPMVGKSWVAVAGHTNNVANETGTLYLPRIPAGTLQSVSSTAPTTVALPAAVVAANPRWAGVEVVVPPGALFSDAGTRGGRVGLAVVAPDRLPSPLPEGLRLPVVITVQTDGPQNFSAPVRARFPNLPDPVTGQLLGPGEKTALWSFNHDSGRWEVQGPATVTSDGLYVESDPGYGIRQPGWHGVAPGVPAEYPEPTLPCDAWTWVDILNALDANRQAVAGSAAEALAFQLYCIATQAAQNANTWGNGWVKEVLKGIACNTQNGRLQDLAQYPCSLVPNGVSLPSPPFLFIPGDTCFAVEGLGYHTVFELLPGFWKHICEITDQQHNDFIEHGILPCLAGNPVLGPVMAPVASYTVPPILKAIREAMQALATCDGDPEGPQLKLAGVARTPTRALPLLPPAPTEAELRVPDLDAAATLDVDAGGRFFLNVGDSLQLRVSHDGRDLTTDPETHYGMLLTAGAAAVTQVGKVTALSTSNSLPVVTPTFYVVVWNGTNQAIAQFAMRDLDTDGDAMGDAYERSVGLDPLVPNPRSQDTDHDGLSDLDEALYHTSPTQVDTDGDGVSDADEWLSGWNPTLATSPSTEELGGSSGTYSWIEDLELHWEARTYWPPGATKPRDQILAPDRRYRRWVYQPSDGRRGSIEFVSSPIGTSMVLPQPILRVGDAADDDGDGLDNEAETIIGTNPRSTDTDGDGASDFDEVRRGEDPLSRKSRPLGLIASLPLPGTARGILRQGNLAYVTTEAQGVSVVDVANPEQPRVVSQRDLTGSAFAMVISDLDRVGAVAASPELGIGTDSALHLLDVANPADLRVLRTLPLPVQAVAEREGLLYVGLRREIRVLDGRTGVEFGWTPTRTDVLGLAIADEKLYAATREGLEILDLTTAIPTTLGSTTTSNTLVSAFFEGDMIVSRGILHAGTGSGYLTLDVSDAQHPVQLSLSRRTPAWIMHGLASNGSGQVASLVSFSGGARDLSFFEATDPLDTDRYLTSFRTKGPAHDLEFFSGVVLVADAQFGLSIFNPSGPDTRGIPPVVLVEGTDWDQDAARPGIQVLAGTTLTVEAEVREDGAMREASLWVDGVRVASRESGPVTFPLPLPAVPPASGILQIQVKAVDLAGNVGESAPLQLEILPNPQPPTLLASFPRPGGAVAPGGPLVLFFDQPLDPLGLATNLIHLVDRGDDGVESNDDRDVPLARAEILDRRLFLYPGAELRSGAHALEIPRLAVRNRAGIPLDQEVRIPLTVFPVTLDDAVWTSPTGGVFQVAAFWSAQRVPVEERVFIPAVAGPEPVVSTAKNLSLRRLEQIAPFALMPGAGLTVTEDWIARGPVTISNALTVVSRSAEFHAPVEITGSTLICQGPVTFHQNPNLVRGSEFILEGPLARWLPEATFTGSASTLTVRNGATLPLPHVVEYEDRGDFSLFLPRSTMWRASGAGSRLIVPELTHLRGPTNWIVRSVPSLVIEATEGGTVDLPQLRVAQDRVLFRVSGRGSSILAPAWETLSGPVSDFLATVIVSASGELHFGERLRVERANVQLSTGGSLRGGTLELGTAATLQGNGKLAGSLAITGRLLLNALEAPLVIEGTLALGDLATSELSLGRVNGTLQSGRVSVGGATTLGGGLKLVVPRGLALAAGEECVLAIFGTPPTGAFSSVDDSALGSALRAEILATPTELRLRLVAR